MKPDSTKTLVCLLCVLLTPGTQAADEDGMGGLLDISGSLHHSACMVEMSSAYQTVELGNIPRSQLQQPGDGATPIAFHLRFFDCRRAAGSITNERTGKLVWSAYHPVVSVAFLAPADADDSRLVQVRGISGLGLGLSDSMGRDVRLGSRGELLFLAHGSDTLTWYVQPTRTPAALSNGAFRAVVDFRLNYE